MVLLIKEAVYFSSFSFLIDHKFLKTKICQQQLNFAFLLNYFAPTNNGRGVPFLTTSTDWQWFVIFVQLSYYNSQGLKVGVFPFWAGEPKFNSCKSCHFYTSNESRQAEWFQANFAITTKEKCSLFGTKRMQDTLQNHD